ncbi:MAG: glycosyltransferase family 39 protein [Phycisphaerae bacterium]|nr:glycosyltransferase family 39 protein [Phycisphaerae bacterium]
MSDQPNGESRPQAPVCRPSQPMSPATRAWFIALLGWTAALSFYHLGGGARFEPIDCWVAQTAREMLDADDWLVPRFSGELRMQKSPGPYWAVMLVSLLRGTPVDEVCARVPNAVAAVVLVATIFWLTRRIAGDRAAVFAGFAASSSVLILWWSHRGASDLGLTTCTTVSLAALWVAAESEPAGPKRNALFLLGYFAAGLGMIYKMPMPLAVVGAPAFFYVLLRNRWRVFGNRWHLVGLLFFLLPWLPWAVAVGVTEEAALLKWRVEFVDRFTGALPNVAGQDETKYLFTYLIPPLLYCLPFTLSLPTALVRAFRKQVGVNRGGTLFMVIWFLSLLAFFTASTGKEQRYFLPALPPLFVLLGVELAVFFDPNRRCRPGLDRAGAVAVWIIIPVALIGGGVFGLWKWYELRGRFDLDGLYEWGDIWRPYAVTAALLAIGFGVAAWLYLRRREHASFGMIVVTMWLMWLWAWPRVMPLMMSQRPYTDFAQQLSNPQKVPPGYRRHIRQVGTQDSRITWYGDVRFPRVIDQLELLKEQEGRRDLDYETRRTGEEMVKMLARDEPVLFVVTLPDYIRFQVQARAELEAEGREMPRNYLWLQARYGREDDQCVLFGNKPPRFPEPALRLSDQVRDKLAERGWHSSPTASQAASRPASNE